MSEIDYDKMMKRTTAVMQRAAYLLQRSGFVVKQNPDPEVFDGGWVSGGMAAHLPGRDERFEFTFSADPESVDGEFGTVSMFQGDDPKPAWEFTPNNTDSDPVQAVIDRVVGNLSPAPQAPPVEPSDAGLDTGLQGPG